MVKWSKSARKERYTSDYEAVCKIYKALFLLLYSWTGVYDGRGGRRNCSAVAALKNNK